MRYVSRIIFVLFFVAAFICLFLASPWLDKFARKVHRKLGYPAKIFGIELPPREVIRKTIEVRPSKTAAKEQEGLLPKPQLNTPQDNPRPRLTQIPRQNLNTAQLWSGIIARRTLLVSPGETASAERTKPTAYQLEFTFTATTPRPVTTLEDFERAHPNLTKLLNDFPLLLQHAKVSEFFHLLYEEKLKVNRRNLDVLSTLLSRHNFYDCDTILEITHPHSQRKIFLIQADMDVVTDGTDPERTLQYDTSSPSFQPVTNYGWLRRTRLPENPTLPGYRKQLQKHRDELQVPNVSEERKLALQKSITYLERLIADLQTRSFLVAHSDPFIVIPSSMRGIGAPQIGDYAVVLHAGRAFPAIVGEYGPREKIGEASTRIAREIAPHITGLQRAVSDLSVTYIIFPGTAEKPFRRPDLQHWYNRVKQLLDDIGGISVPLHQFEDIFLTSAHHSTDSPTCDVQSPSPTLPSSPSSAVPSEQPLSTSTTLEAALSTKLEASETQPVAEQ